MILRTAATQQRNVELFQFIVFEQRMAHSCRVLTQLNAMMDGSAFGHPNIDCDAEYDQFDGDVFGAV